MTTAQNMPGHVWSAVQDTPVHEVFPGIRARPLWTGDYGAKAHVPEMGPQTTTGCTLFVFCLEG